MSSNYTKKAEESMSLAFDYRLFLHRVQLPACFILPSGKIEFVNKAFLGLFRGLGGSEEFYDMDWKSLFDPRYKEILLNAFVLSLNGSLSRINLSFTPPGSDILRQLEVNIQPMRSEDTVSRLLVLFNNLDQVEIFYSDVNSVAGYFEYSPFPIIRIGPEMNILALSENFSSTFGKDFNDSSELSWDDISDIFRYDGEKIRNDISEVFQERLSHRRYGELRVFMKEQVHGTVNISLYPLRLGNKITAAEMIFEDITQLRELKCKIENFRRMSFLKNIGMGFFDSMSAKINLIFEQSKKLQLLEKNNICVLGLGEIGKYAQDAAKDMERLRGFMGSPDSGSTEKVEMLHLVINDALEFVRVHFRVSDIRQENNVVIENNSDYFEVPVKTDTGLLRELIVWSSLRVYSHGGKNGKIIINPLERKAPGLNLACEKSERNSSENPVSHTIDCCSASEIIASAEKLNIRIVEHESAETYSIDIVFPESIFLERDEKSWGHYASAVTNKRVMIIEGDEGLRTILSNLFKRMNNRVFVAENGEIALDEIEKSSYDIVLSDYDASVFTGVELMAKVKEFDDSILTVLMSDWESEDMSAYENIVDIFIPKPFNVEKLLEVISCKNRD